MNKESTHIKYSVVIPLKNEEGNVPDLLQELESVMHGLGSPFEILCIDDGSTDNTLKILLDIRAKKPFVRIIAFDRNYGQSCAFDAGFRHARGEWVISMDGDRQNDPTDIPKLLSASIDADLICGCRIKRQDPLHKKLISRFANAIRKRFCGDNISDTGCSLKLYRSTCLKQIKMYKGMHRFLPALFKIEGFRVKEIPVNHRERTKGKTKYNFFNRSLNTVADMLAVRWMWKRHINYRIDNNLL